LKILALANISALIRAVFLCRLTRLWKLAETQFCCLGNLFFPKRFLIPGQFCVIYVQLSWCFMTPSSYNAVYTSSPLFLTFLRRGSWARGAAGAERLSSAVRGWRDSGAGGSALLLPPTCPPPCRLEGHPPTFLLPWRQKIAEHLTLPW